MPAKNAGIFFWKVPLFFASQKSNLIPSCFEKIQHIRYDKI